MKNILFIISSYLPEFTGGIERETEAYVKTLKKNNLNPAVVTLTTGKSFFEIVDGIPVYRLRFIPLPILEIFTIFYSVLLFIVSHRKEIDAIHSFGTIVTSAAASLGARICKKPTVCGLTSMRFFFCVSLYPYFWVKVIVKYVLIHSSNYILPNFEYMLEEAVRSGMPRKKLRIIPNAINTDVFAPISINEKNKLRKNYGINKSLVVTIASRLAPDKRIKDICSWWPDVIKEYPDSVLLVLGDGPEKNLIDIFIDQNKMRDFLCCFGNQLDIIPFLQMSDYFINAYNQGQSIALLEAMSVGLSILAPDCDGNKSLVTHNVNGLIFQIENKNDFLEKIFLLIENKNLSQSLSQNARDYILKNHKIENITEKCLKLYQEIDVSLSNRKL